MAHSKQALKRARQDERIKNKNKSMRSDMKTHLKALRAAIASKDAKAIKAELTLTQSKLDKAAKRRVIHPNAAARIKSRISKRIAASGKKS